MQRHTLTIYEGPDCSGKTTAVNAARKQDTYRHQGGIVHHGPYKRITDGHLGRFYLEAMKPALTGYGSVVMDRSWLSEPIYGRAFRNGEDRLGATQRRQLERVALSLGAIVILCLPPFEAVLEQWQSRQDDEYLEKEQQLREVYDDYAQLHKQTDLPVIRYDYTVGNEMGMQPLPNAFDPHRPRLHGHTGQQTVGHWDAPVVLVGDDASDPTNHDTLHQFPFGSFSRTGSSAWLTDYLEEHGISERDLLWLNSKHGDLRWLRTRATVRQVIALGNDASDRLTEHKVPHVKVPHPQHHKRFTSAEPYALADHVQPVL